MVETLTKTGPSAKQARNNFPATQTDQRTLSISSVAFDWDWHEYRDTWNARQIAEEMGLAPDEIFNIWSRLDREASRIDPLRDWDDLLRFISVKEKQRLRGKTFSRFIEKYGDNARAVL